MADAARAGSAAYRPRRARDSPLHRLAETHHGTLKQVYDARLAGRYGFWRAEIERTLFAFLDCGIEERGFARVRCNTCRREDEAAGLLSSQHSGFSVHSAIRVEPWDAAGVERLCRYLVHPPIALGRLQYDGARATYRGRHPPPSDRPGQCHARSAGDAGAAVPAHPAAGVPPHQTRLYGACANRTRGARARRLAGAGGPASGAARGPGPLAARSSPRVRGNEIHEAIYVYLLIGILFAQVYRLLLAADPDALHFDPGRFPEPPLIGDALRNRGAGDILYECFITLGTVGYSDVIPSSPLARSLRLIEAVIGIMYVATMIARFVAIQIGSGERDPL